MSLLKGSLSRITALLRPITAQINSSFILGFNKHAMFKCPCGNKLIDKHWKSCVEKSILTSLMMTSPESKLISKKKRKKSASEVVP